MAPVLEPETGCEQVIHSPEIDLRSGEPLVGRQIAFARLVTDLEAGAELPDWHAEAAEHDRPDRRTAADEIPGEDAVLEVDELPGLAVAPGVDADARADVR